MGTPATTVSDQDSESEPRSLGLERIVFFADAVTAIAITLLALEIRVPELAASVARAELPAALGDLGPQITSFVIGFTVIGIYWTGHHRYFSYIVRQDSRLLGLNLCFLFFIVTMPFTASLLGHYVTLPLGVMPYALNCAAIGFSLSALWFYASHDNRLLDAAVPTGLVRVLRVRSFAVPLVFLVTVPVALASPLVAMSLWLLALPVAWLAPRVLARNRQAEGEAPPSAPGN